MKAVSRFESNLLRILHVVLQRAPLGPVLPRLTAGTPRPRCLGRDAVALVQDTLAKGCVVWLARHGGWRHERHLRGDRIAEGRLWERTPPADLALRFSPHALGFLIWLTAAKPAGNRPPQWLPPEAELTFGDRLLMYLAFDALAGTPPARPLQAHPVFQRHALCRLANPEAFLAAPVECLPDFAPWTSGLGACILEVMQGRLADRCLDMETLKGRTVEWQHMQALGQAQERVLQSYLQAVDRAGRRDLARFLLRTAFLLLPEDVRPDRWTGQLAGAGPRLADRTETYRAALTLLHLLLGLREWTQQSRAVGYFDEGYQASQLWKADWERWQGDLLCTRAAAVIQQLDPMRPT